MSLEHSRRILAIEFDPDDLSPGNLKRMALMTNVALSVLSTQVKVDLEKMRTAREAGGSLEEFYRNRAAASEEGSS